MARIVITGGAGFIGSHLCDRFLSAGEEVICVDNLITGSMENLVSIDSPRFRFIRQDVTNFLDIEGTVDYVLHLASLASPADYLNYPIQTLKVGSLGTHVTLGLAKAKRSVYFLASTSEVYGDPQIHPQTEDYWGHVNPVGPRGVYDESKRFAEAMAMAYHRIHSVPVRIGRIFNTYGPRMRFDDGRVIPSFIHQALTGSPLTVFGDGSQTRSFCYIDDMVEGIMALIRSDITTPLNLGTPQESSIAELAHLILDITGSSSGVTYCPLPAEDPKVRCPDINKAESELGWKPKTALRQGLEKTVRDMEDRLKKENKKL